MCRYHLFHCVLSHQDVIPCETAPDPKVPQRGAVAASALHDPACRGWSRAALDLGSGMYCSAVAREECRCWSGWMIFRWRTKEAVFKERNMIETDVCIMVHHQEIRLRCCFSVFWCSSRKFFFWDGTPQRWWTWGTHEVPSLQAAVHCKQVNPFGYVDSSFKVDRRDDVISRGNT